MLAILVQINLCIGHCLSAVMFVSQSGAQSYQRRVLIEKICFMNVFCLFKFFDVVFVPAICSTYYVIYLRYMQGKCSDHRENQLHMFGVLLRYLSRSIHAHGEYFRTWASDAICKHVTVQRRSGDGTSTKLCRHQ